MKLDIESLRALRVVVEEGTFTGAATRLGVTQSAVSWKIKRLEERVGLALLDRSADCAPTPDGEDLLRYAATILDAHDEAVERLSRSDLTGVLRLGTNEDLQGGELADVLARFGRMFPGVRLHVRVHLSGVVREWLADGDVDLALMQLPADDIEPDDEILRTEPLRWVRGADHRFDRTDGSSGAVPVVSFGPGLAYLDAAERALADAGVPWRTAIECPMLSGVQAAVEAGLGVAALNPWNTTDAMVPWEPGDDMPLPEVSELIRRGDGADPELVAALVGALTSELQIEPSRSVERTAAGAKGGAR